MHNLTKKNTKKITKYLIELFDVPSGRELVLLLFVQMPFLLAHKVMFLSFPGIKFVQSFGILIAQEGPVIGSELARP